jgi:hypothetical protein
MDPNKAIQFGQLVQAAYGYAALNPPFPLPTAGTMLNQAYDPFGVGYTIRNVFFGNDLSTDMSSGPRDIVPYGLMMTTKNNDIVIAIRGTEGIWEWLHDFAFLQKRCPFLESGGNTEDGFTDIYTSMRVDNGLTVVETVKAWPLPINTITICGHSLGGSLATLLALDLCANTTFGSKVVVYTYASPRTGDAEFVSTYNHVVPFTVRIANRCDLVPKLPLPPLYDHVSELFELNPTSSGLNPQPLLRFTIPCQHILTSYLYLLSLLPGANKPEALDQSCTPLPALLTSPELALFSLAGAVPPWP